MLAIFLIGEVRVGSFQRNDVSWKEPINLSHSLSSSIYPAVVTDRYGLVHVFWGEDLGGNPVDLDNPLEKSNSIMYIRWDGEVWSEPTDLFYNRSGGVFNFPYATVDQADTLHLVWQGYEGIFYSSARVQEADSVKAWRPARLVAHARGDGPRIYSDPIGGYHIVYAAWEDAKTGGHDGNIYYLNSTDGGVTWSEPVLLSNIPSNLDENAAHPTILMDDKGNLHVIWAEAAAPDWTGSRVQYARSIDGGQNWSFPLEMGHRDEGEKWASMPEIAILPSGELHLVWVCGREPHRCHRLSKDGGLTWSATNLEFGEMISLAGWDTLMIDGNGILYWILQLRYPSAIYYATWTGTNWSGLRVVNDGSLSNGHYMRAASHLGNQIDLVLVHQGEKEVWYLRGVTNANPALALPISNPIPTPTLIPAEIGAASTARETPGAELVFSNEPFGSLIVNNQNTMIFGGPLLVVGLLLLVIVAKFGIFRRQ